MVGDGSTLHPLREAPAGGPDGGGGRRPLRGLDHAEQPQAVQLLHHLDGQGRHRRVPRRLGRPQRGVGRLHRGGRRRVLHRRERARVLLLLLQAPERVRRIHGSVQPHGRLDPRLQEAGDLPRERHAGGRRAGDRVGLRPGRGDRTWPSSAKRDRSMGRLPREVPPTSCPGSSPWKTPCTTASRARCGRPTR